MFENPDSIESSLSQTHWFIHRSVLVRQPLNSTILKATAACGVFAWSQVHWHPASGCPSLGDTQFRVTPKSGWHPRPASPPTSLHQCYYSFIFLFSFNFHIIFNSYLKSSFVLVRFQCDFISYYLRDIFLFVGISVLVILFLGKLKGNFVCLIFTESFMDTVLMFQKHYQWYLKTNKSLL